MEISHGSPEMTPPSPEFEKISRIDFSDVNKGDILRVRAGKDIIEMTVRRVVVDGADIHTQKEVKGKSDGLHVQAKMLAGVISSPEGGGSVTEFSGRAMGESAEAYSPHRRSGDVLRFDTVGTGLRIHNAKIPGKKLTSMQTFQRINTIEIKRAKNEESIK